MDHYQIKKLTEIVFLYLNGERVSLIQGTIVALSAESEKDAKELYKAIKLSTQLEQKLFKTLRVPQNQQKFYVNAPHLFDLLAHLHQDGYGSGHLGHLLTIIDETKYNFYRRLQTAGLLTVTLGGLGTFAYFKPEEISRTLAFITSRLPQILLQWIMRTFSLLKNLTFIGVAQTCLRYLLFAYNTFYHGFSNLSEKMTALFFRTVATGLNLSGYAIIFWASGIATPVSGLLFVAASFVGVIESMMRYCLIRYKPTIKNKDIQDKWIVEADLIREENQRKFAIKETVIRVFFALCMTAIITTWCFIPGSLFLTLGFMAGITLAGWIESITLSRLEARNAIKLQRTLQEASEQEPVQVTRLESLDASKEPTQKPAAATIERIASAPRKPTSTSKARAGQHGFFQPNDSHQIAENTDKLALSM